MKLREAQSNWSIGIPWLVAAGLVLAFWIIMQQAIALSQDAKKKGAAPPPAGAAQPAAPPLREATRERDAARDRDDEQAPQRPEFQLEAQGDPETSEGAARR